MIVAVSFVGVMEPSVDEVVDMITVRDGRMAAPGAVHMTAAIVHRCADVRVGLVHLDHALVDMAFMNVVQVPVVEIVDVILMLHGSVSTSRAVDVIVVRVCGVVHGLSFRGVVASRTTFTGGGCHVPSRIDGGVGFGQYSRSIKTKFPFGAGSQFDSLARAGGSLWMNRSTDPSGFVFHWSRALNE